jgi:hypothetical protein
VGQLARPRGHDRPASAAPVRQRQLSVVEINPLLVTPTGVLALDARIVTGTAETSATKECDGTDSH